MDYCISLLMLCYNFAGASLFIIMIHASLYNIESLLGSDEEPFDLEMEQVGMSFTGAYS